MTVEIHGQRSQLTKAQLALADITNTNGELKPGQAKDFMVMAMDESDILQRVRVAPLNTPKDQVAEIFGEGRVLRPGKEGTALAAADRWKPTFGGQEHDAKLFKGEMNITDELLEDNIEGKALQKKVISLMSRAVSRDIADCVINGDTSSTDTTLAQFNGILKRATSHLVNAGVEQLDKDILRDLLLAMPKKYRKKKKLEYLTSSDAEVQYRDSLSERQTALGDQALAAVGSEIPRVGYGGVPVIDDGLFPEDLGVGSNCTSVLLFDPMNVEVGWWRTIKIEMERNIREGKTIVVITMRMDALFIIEDAVAKAYNVKVHA